MIRKATITDATTIAELMMMAMDNIVYQMIGKADWEEGVQFLVSLILQPNNQYSYDHIWVYEAEERVLGMINIYDGGQLHALRKPVLTTILARGVDIGTIEDETSAGEMFIDTLAVKPEARGQGIARQLLQHTIQQYVIEQQGVVGLLVHVENPTAKGLYQRMGFQEVGIKYLLGEQLEHLQYK